MNGNIPVDSETQDMLRSFVSEAFDSLDTNEPLVEQLREDDNSEMVNAIFRVFHTLKGLSGFFEMQVINHVTHEAETLLDIMRKQNRPQSEETITVIYQTFDFLRDLLQRVSVDFTDQSGEGESEDMILVIKDAIEKVKAGTDNADQAEQKTAIPAVEPQPIVAEPVAESHTEPMEETPAAETIENGSMPVEETNSEERPPENNTAPQAQNPETFEYSSLISDEMLDQYLSSAYELVDTAEKNLVDLEKDTENGALIAETFGAIHSLKGNSGFMGFSEIEEISIEMETILDCLRSKTLEVDTNIISILLSNTEVVRNRLDKIAKGPQADAEEESKEVHTEAPPVQACPVNKSTNDTAVSAKTEEPAASKPVAVPAPSKIPETAKTIASQAQAEVKHKQEKLSQLNTNLPHVQKKDIRVETTKIDKLFDLVGELITIEAMVTNSPDLSGLELPNFNKSANMLNKISRELQEISMSIRMMPLEGLFNKMKRLVRDVSLKVNKKINLEIYGAQTEMDKNVIDEISDPLVHILRNAVDHGVEAPEVRVEKGKPEEGKVILGARYEGNEILIIVEDDGAGIKRDVILKKAEEKGMLKTPPELMTDREVFNLLFEPGFSTAKEVTDISGRGVGMDVVRKNLEKLRGSIDVASTPNKGSRFTLRIPLTLAIMDAMVIKIGDCLYALPILALRESIRANNQNITVTMDGLEVIKVRDEILPIIRLHEVFHIDDARTNLEEGILLIIESKEKKVCLLADDIIGQQQAVIKGLTDYIGKVPGLTGCMVTGDGSIGLILDIDSLIDLAQTNGN